MEMATARREVGGHTLDMEWWAYHWLSPRLMKLSGEKMPPGEFAFKALVSYPNPGGPREWHLSLTYFFSREDAEKSAPSAMIKWPVEEFEDGTVYIPSKEELEKDYGSI